MKKINLNTVGSLVGTFALALPLAMASVPATAQETINDTTWSDGSSSWLPYTSHGYVGINLGQPRFDHDTCAPAFNCSDSNLGGEIYTGGMFNRNIGLELGYVDVGKLDRNGGDVSARGVNFSLVGNVPAGPVNVFGKVGSTYGWTETRALVGARGDERGWGMSYGAGVGFDVTQNSQLLVEWDRTRFKAAYGDQDVDLTTVGLKHRF